MEPDYKDILQRIVDQIDIDFAADEDVSQDLWDLHIEGKIALR